MTSQKSNAANAIAAAPKRQRGHARVAAIMDAGAAVFLARGYEAATMTEIAAASRTAIGSLYRFFPTKAALADALLERFGERMEIALAEIAAAAAVLSPGAVVDRIVDMMLDRADDRLLALALIDADGFGDEQRLRWRDVMRGRIATILAGLGVPEVRLAIASSVVLRLVKTVGPLAEDEAAGHAGALAELRRLLALYLADISGGPARDLALGGHTG